MKKIKFLLILLVVLLVIFMIKGMLLGIYLFGVVLKYIVIASLVAYVIYLFSVKSKKDTE